MIAPVTRNPDPCDTASAVTDSMNEAAVAQARRLAQPEQVQLPNGDWPHTECVDCGLDIEPARLRMGKVRCFACQSAKEARAKVRGRL